MRVYLDGRLVDESEARVSIFDRGFLFGDGIFESLRAVSGVVFRIDRHLERLERSAALTGLALPWGRPDLAQAIDAVLRGNDLRDARVRLTVTRGPGRPGDYVDAVGPPTLAISASAFAGLAAELHRQGVRVAIPGRRAVPADALDPAIKSTSRLASVLARREARARGAFEAVLLDGEGHLTEGTASNLFLARGGVLSTPPVPEGALPGVTREAVLDLARAAGIPVAVERLPAERLPAADEAFLTNTSWDVLPVVAVGDRPVGDGAPGPLSVNLLERYRNLLRRECCGG